ncbi:hypothetical protein CPB85DRAFT_814099 [Mucidula mucida]|nr:hypothetical protein CPB85DRAFT_814099 [Mucidula mucida]
MYRNSLIMPPRDTNPGSIPPRFRRPTNNLRRPYYHHKSLDVKRREICFLYLKNECPYGPMCHRIHIDPSDEEFHNVDTVPVNLPPGKLFSHIQKTPISDFPNYTDRLNICSTPYNDHDTYSDESYDHPVQLGEQTPLDRPLIGTPHWSDSELSSVEDCKSLSPIGARDGNGPCPVGVCRDYCRGRCWHKPCKFLHIPHSHDPLIQAEPVDPPKLTKHPHPKSNEICWGWENDWCHLGFECDFVHGDLQYDSPVPEIINLPDEEPEDVDIRYPRPRNNATCVYWLRGYCHRGPTCPWFHGDLNYEDPPDWPLPDDGPADQLLHPRPPRNETCRASRLGHCNLGYDCKYVHEDLVYDDPIPGLHIPLSEVVPSSCQPVRNPVLPSEWNKVVHDHIRVKLGPGFDILDVTTGFETPWLFVYQLPPSVTESSILKLLSSFGKVEIKTLSRNMQSTDVKARYEEHIDARNASTSLDNTQQFGRVIRAHLSVNTSASGGILKDCTVRVHWDAPSIIGYGGYPSIQRAEQAIALARKPFRGYQLRAQLYEGLPAVGLYTVKFWNLPVDVKKEDMSVFAEPTGMVWEPLPYVSVSDAASSIRRMISRNIDLLGWEMTSPPYRDGTVRVFARFATPADASQAAGIIHLRKPQCIGGKRVYAHHQKELTFKLTASSYTRIKSDISDFRDALISQESRTEPFSGINVLHRQNDTVMIKLFSDDLKSLGRLKARFEKIQRGEVAMFEGKFAWDRYFGLPVGIVFLDGLQRRYPNLLIHRDSIGRRIVLHGPSSTRASAQQDIVAKLKDLRQRQARIVPILGTLLGFVVSSVYPKLKRDFGEEVVSVDLWNRNLIVRGTASQWATAKRAVQSAAGMQKPARRKATVECPICFDEVDSPCTFRCGHKYCRSCLKEYLLAAQDSRFFPLTCLGSEANCTELIPLAAAKEFLTTSEFDTLVTAAYSAHIAKRPNEFHPCPTPDCPQVYRAGPPGNILQCPACLARICSTCHSEEHEGVECPDSDGQEQAFKEWKSQHDVKACPGCKVDIERAEGCNHVTCTRCQTHICWVCSATFPRGEGIYDHMRAAHGGIGLEPVF